MLCPLDYQRRSKEKHRFQLSKSLGQNFITDKHVIERIVEGADPSEKIWSSRSDRGSVC